MQLLQQLMATKILRGQLPGSLQKMLQISARLETGCHADQGMNALQVGLAKVFPVFDDPGFAVIAGQEMIVNGGKRSMEAVRIGKRFWRFHGLLKFQAVNSAQSADERNMAMLDDDPGQGIFLSRTT